MKKFQEMKNVKLQVKSLRTAVVLYKRNIK
jgi:hypothetical protein